MTHEPPANKEQQHEGHSGGQPAHEQAPAAPPPPTYPTIVAAGRAGLQDAVKQAVAPEQLEQLLAQFPAKTLNPPELVLFMNQLSKVTISAATTARAWGKTQVQSERAMQAPVHSLTYLRNLMFSAC